MSSRYWLWLSLLMVGGCGGGDFGLSSVDQGTVTGNVYRNRHFGMTVTVPKTWSIQEQKTVRKMMEMGGKVVAGDDVNMKRIVKSAESQYRNLLTAFKHPPGSPVPYNPNLVCLVSAIHLAPGIKSGSDFNYNVTKFAKQSKLNIEVTDRNTSRRYGGLDFDVMSQEMKVMKMVVRQKYCTAIVKGKALTFILSYQDEEGWKDLEGILKSITFAP